MREKLLATCRAGVMAVVLTLRNRTDVEALPEQIRAGIVLHLIESLEDVTDLVLLPLEAG